jgi:hypothetical protein
MDLKNASPFALLFSLWEFAWLGCAISHIPSHFPSLQSSLVTLDSLPIGVINTRIAAALATLPLIRLAGPLWLRIIGCGRRVIHRFAGDWLAAAHQGTAA